LSNYNPENLNRLSLTTNDFPNYEFKEESPIQGKDAADQISTIYYRNFIIPIYMDDPGQQFYCKLEDEDIGFGAFNTNYKDDIIYLVDSKLDFIYSFADDYHGAKLEWFANAQYRDIRLVYRSRVLKVFTIFGKFQLTEDKVRDLVSASIPLLANAVFYKNRQ